MFSKLLIAIVLASSNLFAVTYKGVEFPDSIQVQNVQLELNGNASRKYLQIVDVYLAGLYVPKKSKDKNEILNSEGPKRIVMHFKRQVDKGSLQKAWKEGFNENAAKGYSYREDLNKLDSLMTFFKIGETMEITFLKDKAEFKIKNEPIQTIEGKDFSETLLKIFLNHTDLQKGLLGN